MNAVRTGGDRDAIAKLKSEIERMVDSQRKMVVANRALESGDERTLVELGFATDHIEDLKQRTILGKAGFPEYALRNNADAIEHLQLIVLQMEQPEVPDED